MTQTQIHATISPCTPILSADPTVKEDAMLDQQKITILYCRLSNEDISRRLRCLRRTNPAASGYRR